MPRERNMNSGTVRVEGDFCQIILKKLAQGAQELFGELGLDVPSPICRLWLKPTCQGAYAIKKDSSFLFLAANSYKEGGTGQILRMGKDGVPERLINEDGSPIVTAYDSSPDWDYGRQENVVNLERFPRWPFRKKEVNPWVDVPLVVKDKGLTRFEKILDSTKNEVQDRIVGKFSLDIPVGRGGVLDPKFNGCLFKGLKKLKELAEESALLILRWRQERAKKVRESLESLGSKICSQVESIPEKVDSIDRLEKAISLDLSDGIGEFVNLLLNPSALRSQKPCSKAVRVVFRVQGAGGDALLTYKVARFDLSGSLGLSYSGEAPGMVHPYRKVGEYLSGVVHEKKKPVLLNWIGETPENPVLPEFYLKRGDHESLVIFPVLYKGKALGVLEVSAKWECAFLGALDFRDIVNNKMGEAYFKITDLVYQGSALRTEGEVGGKFEINRASKVDLAGIVQALVNSKFVTKYAEKAIYLKFDRLLGVLRAVAGRCRFGSCSFSKDLECNFHSAEKGSCRFYQNLHGWYRYGISGSGVFENAISLKESGRAEISDLRSEVGRIFEILGSSRTLSCEKSIRDSNSFLVVPVRAKGSDPVGFLCLALKSEIGLDKSRALEILLTDYINSSPSDNKEGILPGEDLGILVDREFLCRGASNSFVRTFGCDPTGTYVWRWKKDPSWRRVYFACILGSTGVEACIQPSSKEEIGLFREFNILGQVETGTPFIRVEFEEHRVEGEGEYLEEKERRRVENLIEGGGKIKEGFSKCNVPFFVKVSSDFRRLLEVGSAHDEKVSVEVGDIRIPRVKVHDVLALSIQSLDRVRRVLEEYPQEEGCKVDLDIDASVNGRLGLNTRMTLDSNLINSEIPRRIGILHHVICNRAKDRHVEYDSRKYQESGYRFSLSDIDESDPSMDFLGLLMVASSSQTEMTEVAKKWSMSIDASLKKLDSHVDHSDYRYQACCCVRDLLAIFLRWVDSGDFNFNVCRRVFEWICSTGSQILWVSRRVGVRVSLCDFEFHRLWSEIFEVRENLNNDMAEKKAISRDIDNDLCFNAKWKTVIGKLGKWFESEKK